MMQRLGLATEEEWLDWLDFGEGNDFGLWPYVPRSPKVYYGERGEWLGWTIWLTGKPPEK